MRSTPPRDDVTGDATHVAPRPAVSHIGWRPIVPLVVLLSMATLQIVLVATRGLTPWKGGGFGMFSTLDDAPHRSMRIVVEAPGRSEEVAIPLSIEDEAVKALTLPTDHRLRRLAQAVADRERRYGREATTVRITVWKHDVDPVSLGFTPVVLREFSHDVDP